MTKKVTQELFDTFMVACAKEGWMVDQIEVESVLQAISSRFGLLFDGNTYQKLIDRMDEDES